MNRDWSIRLQDKQTSTLRSWLKSSKIDSDCTRKQWCRRDGHSQIGKNDCIYTLMRVSYSLSYRMRQEKREICLKSVERAREAREKYTKLKPISPPTTMTPQNKESTDKKRSSEGRRRNKQLTAESEETRVNIDSFEAHMNTMPSSGSPPKPLGTTGTVSIKHTIPNVHLFII